MSELPRRAFIVSMGVVAAGLVASPAMAIIRRWLSTPWVGSDPWGPHR